MIVSCTDDEGNMTSVERVDRMVKLVKNGSYIDINRDGKWLFGLDRKSLIEAIQLDEQGSSVNGIMNYDIPI